jgi:hypothetical protein
LTSRQRPLQGQLATHLAAQDELGLGKAEVGGQDVVVDGVCRLGLAGKHLGHGRGRVGGYVEVVGEVALRIEVDAQDLEAAAAVGVGERAHRGGLPGAALLGENGDRRGQGSDLTGRPRGSR